MTVVSAPSSLKASVRPEMTVSAPSSLKASVRPEEPSTFCPSPQSLTQLSQVRQHVPVVQAVVALSGGHCQQMMPQKVCWESLIKSQLNDFHQELTAAHEAAMADFRQAWEVRLEAEIARRTDLTKQFDMITKQIHSLHASVNKIASQQVECKQFEKQATALFESVGAALKMIQPLVASTLASNDLPTVTTAQQQCGEQDVRASETNAGLLQGSLTSSPCTTARSGGGGASNITACLLDASQHPEFRERQLAWHHMTHPAPDAVKAQSSAGSSAMSARMKQRCSELAALESGAGDGLPQPPSSQPLSSVASSGCASSGRNVTFAASDSNVWQQSGPTSGDSSLRVDALEAALTAMHQEEQERIHGLQSMICELKECSRRCALVMLLQSSTSRRHV
eukprot:CAMPEP_0172719784 /NCGR_PEP_ID=MMETSP1074-20121228/75703_1 /TAXON_ID=2916 /ORGANISM="Ceratium fusus, Strain PA161109" /LENGTH=394 /DNA_ID=CAMNT_0013545175 /DNA_START=28 /DNA_END=1212 /DNA_ORIENTATION=+